MSDTSAIQNTQGCEGCESLRYTTWHLLLEEKMGTGKQLLLSREMPWKHTHSNNLISRVLNWNYISDK